MSVTGARKKQTALPLGAGAQALGGAGGPLPSRTPLSVESCCLQAPALTLPYSQHQFPHLKQRTVLVVCGPEQNGAVGLVCARHLRVFEYEPTIFYPTRSLDLLHQDLTTQCEKMDIPFLSYLPTEVQLINDAYGLVVDAVLGPGVEPSEVGGPCTRALATLKLLSIPLVSLDIPSGMLSKVGTVGPGGLGWRPLYSGSWWPQLACPI
ncbi:Hypothetical predicted protein [Marmota monax]|uniref:YjeF N-terminal domain-containing protein n=1 Tax=Marmota monax TaxID=9995 RepID=A0A5E4ACL8_MARMO|nr:hypothetical protein GHT09_002981 [Marmota monax]VTJ54646.1 Hypothetical predicted protein [Marmota monax]